MRVTKTYEERYDEILNTAERLFITKGYNNTSIAELISEIKIAKGTFYYYFTSKEEVMDAVITRYTEYQGGIFKKIASDNTLSALDKLQKMLEKSNELKETDTHQLEMLEVVHTSNAEIHMRSITKSMAILIPIITKVIEQGNREGVFYTQYPKTAAEVIVTSLQILFNDDFLPATSEEMMTRLYEYSAVCEDILGLERGKLDFIVSLNGGELK